MPDTNQSSELGGNIPHDSESLRAVPIAAESFRNILKTSERKESHTLTVREVARMFESAGVARTERSIINWCQPNRMGVQRLDGYLDPNERRYFISPQSVEFAIKEEQAKAAKTLQSSEPVRNAPKASIIDSDNQPSNRDGIKDAAVKTLEHEVRDLQITNQAKDYYIDRLEKERESFVEKLISSSHRIGELETKLLRLEAPNTDGRPKVESSGESVDRTT